MIRLIWRALCGFVDAWHPPAYEREAYALWASENPEAAWQDYLDSCH